MKIVNVHLRIRTILFPPTAGCNHPLLKAIDKSSSLVFLIHVVPYNPFPPFPCSLFLKSLPFCDYFELSVAFYYCHVPCPFPFFGRMQILWYRTLLFSFLISLHLTKSLNFVIVIFLSIAVYTVRIFVQVAFVINTQVWHPYVFREGDAWVCLFYGVR